MARAKIRLRDQLQQQQESADLPAWKTCTETIEQGFLLSHCDSLVRAADKLDLCLRFALRCVATCAGMHALTLRVSMATLLVAGFVSGIARAADTQQDPCEQVESG